MSHLRLDELYRVEDVVRLSRHYILTGPLASYSCALDVANEVNHSPADGTRFSEAVSCETSEGSAWAVHVSVSTDGAWGFVNQAVNLAVQRLAAEPS